MHRNLAIAALSLSLAGNCLAAPGVAEQCVADLDSIPGFLLENDTGARDHLALLGQKHFDEALAAARVAAAAAQDEAACNQALNDYLHAWRKGHLWAVQAPAAAAVANTAANGSSTSAAQAPAPAQVSNPSTPTLRLLSNKTIVLTLNSFHVGVGETLSALIKQHRRELETHPNWIIDVRRNDGGSDASYQPLLGWIAPGETALVGAELLATPANIASWQKMCAQVAPGNPACEAQVRPIVDSLRSTEPGHYAPMPGAGGIEFNRTASPETHRPAHVAVLIDHPCGSSCEQFLLQVRQSFSVKLIGRRTYGALDYSNVIEHDLPSGRHQLWYASSRSKRIPNLPVDAVGVLPDIYLPPPADEKEFNEEVTRVQRWLEGGSLMPGNPA